MSVLLYRYIANSIAFVHLIVIGLNLLAVPFVIVMEPFYIWMPIITLLVSPVVGGTYCMYNRLENHFRDKAGMPLITDRIGQLLKGN